MDTTSDHDITNNGKPIHLYYILSFENCMGVCWLFPLLSRHRIQNRCRPVALIDVVCALTKMTTILVI